MVKIQRNLTRQSKLNRQEKPSLEMSRYKFELCQPNSPKFEMILNFSSDLWHSRAGKLARKHLFVFLCFACEGYIGKRASLVPAHLS